MTHLQGFFVENCLPFNIIQSESFRSLVNFLNGQIVPPHRKSFTQSVDELFLHVKEGCRLEIQKPKFISITSDTWKDQLNKQHMAMTAHFIVGSQFKNLVISTKQITRHHTGMNLQKEMENVL